VVSQHFGAWSLIFYKKVIRQYIVKPTTTEEEEEEEAGGRFMCPADFS
jgi:hypothetical protein